MSPQVKLIMNQFSTHLSTISRQLVLIQQGKFRFDDEIDRTVLYKIYINAIYIYIWNICYRPRYAFGVFCFFIFRSLINPPVVDFEKHFRPHTDQDLMMFYHTSPLLRNVSMPMPDMLLTLCMYASKKKYCMIKYPFSPYCGWVKCQIQW